jgi:NTE family protein
MALSSTHQATHSPFGESIESFQTAQYDADGIALALSGGGYKAAAFHLGSLIRLNQLGYLRKIDRISSVSGGSIAAGYLGLKWKALTWNADGVATNFHDEFVEPLREFLLNVNIDVPQILLGLVPLFPSAVNGVIKAYARHLFGQATLQDLPSDGDGPRFELVATNYELNSLWRFSKPYAADYRVGQILKPTFSLAEIVAASSAFPPFFCPLEIDFAGQTVESLEGADRHDGRFLERASVCDGGIYDNMGLEPIWKRFGTLLVSNAGNPIDEEVTASDWGGTLLRIIGLVHRQAENNRQRILMMMAQTGMRKIAYWPLRNSNTNYPKPSTAIPSAAAIASAQREGVRLWSLGASSFANLVNHGYSLTDSAMQSYLDVGPAPPAAVLPA